MNQKATSSITIDLTFRLRRQIAFRDLLKLALPVMLLLLRLAAHLHGGPLALAFPWGAGGKATRSFIGG